MIVKLDRHMCYANAHLRELLIRNLNGFLYGYLSHVMGAGFAPMDLEERLRETYENA